MVVDTKMILGPVDLSINTVPNVYTITAPAMKSAVQTTLELIIELRVSRNVKRSKTARRILVESKRCCFYVKIKNKIERVLALFQRLTSSHSLIERIESTS